MAGLSFRAFFYALALLLPAALLAVFMGTPAARASTLEKQANAPDVGPQVQLQMARDAKQG